MGFRPLFQIRSPEIESLFSIFMEEYDSFVLYSHLIIRTSGSQGDQGGYVDSAKTVIPPGKVKSIMLGFFVFLMDSQQRKWDY